MSLNAVVSTGRGGAGNMVGNRVEADKADEVIMTEEEFKRALVQDGERQEIGLSPVFSTGRGGAGNIHKADRATKTKVTLESELSEQLSPIHSTPSRKSRGSRGGCENGEERVGFLGKLKKFFK
ncbi:hypothetical protein CAS74_001866 [Pichia kudriavzevii]|uniref:Uncharacterized protein n=1 Tax=Pichia kudriavzevii TaxID=4909 RepID=A0A1Z8JSJ7_PICKU|nr:hypothetical protein CAS74_001866 [Pichia kudriavzevii]